MELNGLGMGCLALVAALCAAIFSIFTCSAISDLDSSDNKATESECVTTTNNGTGNIATASPSKTVSIENVWIEQNIINDNDNECGMMIHVTFQTFEMEGESGCCWAKFFKIDKKPAHNYTHEGFHNNNYEMVTTEQFTCRYNGSYYKDFKLHIPYSVLETNNEENRATGFIIYITQTNEKDGTIILGQTKMYLFDTCSSYLELTDY